MRRNIDALCGILSAVLEFEAQGKPIAFFTEILQDESLADQFGYYRDLLVEGGLLRIINPQPEFEGKHFYRVTWKGHCFLDLYERRRLAKREGKELESFIADIALESFQ